MTAATLRRVIAEAPSTVAVVDGLLGLDANPDPVLEAEPSIWADVLRRVDETTAAALHTEDPAAFLAFQRVLRRLCRMKTTTHRNAQDLSWHLNGLFTRMAGTWVEHERSLVPPAERPARDIESLIEQFCGYATSHWAADHPIFAFLGEQASHAQFVEFLVQERTIDSDFVDMVALTQIGFRGAMKTELARNFWDEMGDGDPLEEHGTMFDAGLVRVAAPDHEAEDDLIAGSLACGNLQYVLGLHRSYHLLSVGALGALETAVPIRFLQLRSGAQRLGLPDVVVHYYGNHVTADEIHSEGWVRRVVAPAIEDDPTAWDEILAGLHIRLSVAGRYCDQLLERLRAWEPVAPASL